MHQREKGSVEARLATVRLGIFTVTSLITVIVIGFAARFYAGFRNANDIEGVDYSVGDYISDAGPIIIQSLVIILVVALVFNFGYTYYLKNQVSEDK